MLLYEFCQSHHNFIVKKQQIGEEIAKEITDVSWKSKDYFDKRREMSCIESMSFYRKDCFWKGEWWVRGKLLLLQDLFPTSWRQLRSVSDIIGKNEQMNRSQ